MEILYNLDIIYNPSLKKNTDIYVLIVSSLDEIYSVGKNYITSSTTLSSIEFNPYSLNFIIQNNNYFTSIFNENDKVLASYRGLSRTEVINTILLYNT